MTKKSTPQVQNRTVPPGIIPGNMIEDVLSNLQIAKEMSNLMDSLQASTTKTIVIALTKHCGKYNKKNTHKVNKLRFIIQNNINVIVHRLTKSMAEFTKRTEKYASEMTEDFCDEGQEYFANSKMRCQPGNESCTKEIGKVGGSEMKKQDDDSITDDDVLTTELVANSSADSLTQIETSQTTKISSTRRRNIPTNTTTNIPIRYEDFRDGREIIEKGQFANKNIFNKPENLTKLHFKVRTGESKSLSTETEDDNSNIVNHIKNIDTVNNKKVSAKEDVSRDDEPEKHDHDDDKQLKAATYEYDTDDSDAIKSKSNFIPKTVKLSKENKDFYEDRKWPGGVLRYMIGNEDSKYNLNDLRKRLDEVNKILKDKTCVRLVEISQKAKERYNDFIVLDTSPDYVTGRVGKEQHFGSIELFEGGQHRQHTAMMVMAMLGFYFECARHDRDDYVRVHIRHIRPEKLHHFEKIRQDATFALPYDFRSATHPAWQFWRKLGKTGISTVATYKVHDPDGSIMKSLGQNEDLLSDLDIIKINSVYGTKCFRSFRRNYYSEALGDESDER